MKVKEILKIIKDDGWFHLNTRGSHRQFKHPIKKRKVPVAGKLNEDIHPKTAKSILNQAGIK